MGVGPEDRFRHRFWVGGGGLGVGGGEVADMKVSQVYLEAVEELLTLQLSFRVSKHIFGLTLKESSPPPSWC